MRRQEFQDHARFRFVTQVRDPVRIERGGGVPKYKIHEEIATGHVYQLYELGNCWRKAVQKHAMDVPSYGEWQQFEP